MSETNGDGPVIDLDAIMGPRVAARTVVLAGEKYRLRPISLVTAKLLEEGQIEDALRSLLVDPTQYDSFAAAFPVAHTDEVLAHIYGGKILGEAAPRSAGSARKKGASKPSKRTSSPAGSTSSAS